MGTGVADHGAVAGRKPVGGDALASLRDLGAGGDPAVRERARGGHGGLGVRGDARLRARLSRRALRHRSHRRGGTGRAGAPRRALRGSRGAAGEQCGPALGGDCERVVAGPGGSQAAVQAECEYCVVVDHELRDQLEADLEGEGDDEEPSFFTNPKRLLQTFVAVLVLVLAIYVLLPNVVGLGDAVHKLTTGNPVWLAIAGVFTVMMFLAYVALF